MKHKHAKGVGSIHLEARLKPSLKMVFKMNLYLVLPKITYVSFNFLSTTAAKKVFNFSFFKTSYAHKKLVVINENDVFFKVQV